MLFDLLFDSLLFQEVAYSFLDDERCSIIPGTFDPRTELCGAHVLRPAKTGIFQFFPERNNSVEFQRVVKALGRDVDNSDNKGFKVWVSC